MSFKDLLNEKGISQQDLCRKIDMDKGLMSRHVSQDLSHATVATLKKISEALDCNVLLLMPDFCSVCGYIKCKCRKRKK